LVNYGKPIIFTTSPSFPFVAAIKPGYNFLDTSQGQIVSTSNHPTYLAISTLILRQARKRVQSNVRLFFSTLTSHILWDKARDGCVLRVPLVQGWQDRKVLTHIVPPGQSRLRISSHADYTADQIKGLVDAMFTWAKEIFAIDEGETEEKESSVIK
jgi:8-amino-7-oxononanoate synthase